MNYQISPERPIHLRKRTSRNEKDYVFPSVTIILPFNPKMKKKEELKFSLQRIVNEAVCGLTDNFPGDMAVLTIHKLRHIIRNLNFNTHKQSLAIFLSPVFEKVIYFNMPVNEKVIVSDALQISNVIRHRKDTFNFHILLLGEKESRLYFHSSGAYLKLSGGSKASWQHQIYTGRNADKMCNFDGFSLRQKTVPLLVMGNQKLIGQFKKTVHYPESVIAYVSTGFQPDSPKKIRETGQNILDKGSDIRRNFIARLIKEGMDEKRIITDLSDMKDELKSGEGRILFIHEAYLYQRNPYKELMSYGFISAVDKFSCIKTHTDELIEIALTNDVDIEVLQAGINPASEPFLLLKTFIE